MNVISLQVQYLVSMMLHARFSLADVSAFCAMIKFFLVLRVAVFPANMKYTRQLRHPIINDNEWELNVL